MLKRAVEVAWHAEPISDPVTTPAGTFHDCVEVTETSPLEPGHESLKRYCPGIGLVQDNDAMLEELDLHRDGDDDD